MAKCVVVAAIVVLALGPSKAAAESFVVSGNGSQFTFDFEGDFFRFAGSDFAIVHDGDHSLGSFIPRVSAPSCTITNDCDPGDVVNHSFATPGEISLGGGNATIHGTSFTDVLLHGSLAFSATPLDFPAVAGDFVVLRTAFTFLGAIRGIADGKEVFVADLTGRGHSFQVLFRTNGGWFATEEGRLDFVFDDATPDPVPEPASLVLLGTGALGVAAARRRRTSAGQRVS